MVSISKSEETSKISRIWKFQLPIHKRLLSNNIIINGVHPKEYMIWIDKEVWADFQKTEEFVYDGSISDTFHSKKTNINWNGYIR